MSAGNVQQAQSNVVQPRQWQSGNAWPQYWPTTTYWQVPDPESGRLRFALELILEGGLTHDAVKRIAEKALKK